MKIKYIGNFNDGTGWAKASTYNALALDAAGYDVYCSEVKYNNVNNVLEQRITELLTKESSDFDVVIQHVLPMDYKYVGGAKNIGFIALENVKFSNRAWLASLKIMDDIFVPNVASKEALAMNKIESKVFNHSFNLSKIQNSPKVTNIPELDGKFNFVFVGEFVERKNIEALVLAFHNEFHYTEPVNLYIKTSGKSPQEVKGFCDEVKAKMKKTTRYKAEIIVSDYMDENALWSTLRQCHAFAMPSRGEAWCYPAMEAMAIGIPVIYTDGIGVGDYVKNLETGLSVLSYATPCYGANDTFQDIYTSKDAWLEPSIYHLQAAMRNMYLSYISGNENFNYNNFSNNCLEAVKKYDYTNSKLVEGLL